MVSSAARIPFPSATSVSATLSSSWLVMRILPVLYSCGIGVALLILRAPGGNEGVAAAATIKSNKICAIRSIGSSKHCGRACWRARWRGRFDGAGSWPARAAACSSSPASPLSGPRPNTPNSPRHPFCPMPDKPKTTRLSAVRGARFAGRGPNEMKNREEGHETSVDRRSARRRSGREHDETGGGPLGLGLGMGARRVRHRRADWCGVVAAGLLLLLSGLRLLPRVWLWLRLSGLRLRLRLSVLLRRLRRLRRLLPALLRRVLWRLLWLPASAAIVIHHACWRQEAFRDRLGRRKDPSRQRRCTACKFDADFARRSST